jgi:peroxiredoxin
VTAASKPADHDPYRLPPDLPVPVDDGACDHLPGQAVPSLELPATRGGSVDLGELARELAVLYVYPRTGRPGLRTGRPGLPPPEGWDAIPGARGCTPQSCAFRDHHAELARAGARLAGLSAQPAGEQQEFAERERLRFPLLSDPELRLASALGLPTFEFGGDRLYRRVSLVLAAGRIAKVFHPVFPPDENAAEVLAWLRASAVGGRACAG